MGLSFVVCSLHRAYGDRETGTVYTVDCGWVRLVEWPYKLGFIQRVITTTNVHYMTSTVPTSFHADSWCECHVYFR